MHFLKSNCKASFIFLGHAVLSVIEVIEPQHQHRKFSGKKILFWLRYVIYYFECEEASKLWFLSFLVHFRRFFSKSAGKRLLNCFYESFNQIDGSPGSLWSLFDNFLKHSMGLWGLWDDLIKFQFWFIY